MQGDHLHEACVVNLLVHVLQHSIEHLLPAILCHSRPCVRSGNQVRRDYDTVAAPLTSMTVKYTEQVHWIDGMVAATAT